MRAVANHAPALQLSARDPVLSGLVALHGLPPVRRPLPASERFGALARAICYQQLAGKAAASIHGRLLDAVGGEMTAERVLGLETAALTACGLSRSKAAAIDDLARHVSTGTVSLARIGRLSDEEVVGHLVRVRGIGRWTAEMFLMTALARPDVWPVGDYGVRAGFARGWGLPEVPSAAELISLGEAYRPFRSTLAWYCWRVADGPSVIE